MPSNITKLSGARAQRCATKSFQNWMHWAKQKAHQWTRRRARQVAKTTHDDDEIDNAVITPPRLTSWDVF